MLDPEYEAPLFKKLAKNDTGQRSSHQGGFVLPKDLRKYFPALPEPTAQEPTPDVPIQAVLLDGPAQLGTVATRYQLQSWGGTRTGETRVTGNVDRLLDTAVPDDILLIERKADREDEYRLTLLRHGTPGHSSLSQATGAIRWGVVPGLPQPVSDVQIEKAQADLLADLDQPFVPFQQKTTTSQISMRIARSKAFVRLVMRAYGRRCAICGGGILRADGVSEIEAAHIIGKAESGADDVRNGLALCRSDHWAFDHFVCSVDENLTFRMRPELLGIPGNQRLSALNGAKIQVPDASKWRPHPQALRWHYERVFPS